MAARYHTGIDVLRSMPQWEVAALVDAANKADAELQRSMNRRR